MPLKRPKMPRGLTGREHDMALFLLSQRRSDLSDTDITALDIAASGYACRSNLSPEELHNALVVLDRYNDKPPV